jgi:hypothetical protein
MALKREDVTEGWRKLLNGGLQESSWDSRIIKQRRMRGQGMWEK